MDYLDEFTVFVDGLLIYLRNTVEHEIHVTRTKYLGSFWLQMASRLAQRALQLSATREKLVIK